MPEDIRHDLAGVDRPARLARSRRKIRPPFVLDETMCFYSPQENVEALKHRRVAEWLEFIEHDWVPRPIGGCSARRVAVLLPCTKYKPYTASREHKAINGALLAAGWRSTGQVSAPGALRGVLAADEQPDLLDASPLVRRAVALDRFVVSEPLALVPYEHIYTWNDRQSPACSYDDPGLFESRGDAVSPERKDFTGFRRGDGRWRWGPTEWTSYAEVHNRLAVVLANTLDRLKGHYAAVIAWVSPGLTHRSFLASDALRCAEGLRRKVDVADRCLPLVGVGDLQAGLVQVLPTREQLEHALEELARRLRTSGRPCTAGSTRSVFARGDGHDTPLGLAETLSYLVAAIDVAAREP